MEVPKQRKKGRPMEYETRGTGIDQVKVCPICDASISFSNPHRHMKENHSEWVNARNDKRVSKKAKKIVTVPKVNDQLNALPNMSNCNSSHHSHHTESSLDPFNFADNLTTRSSPVKIWTPYNRPSYSKLAAPSDPIIVFSPKPKEMEQYTIVEYVTKVIEKAKKFDLNSGLVKIVPPEDYQARYDNYELVEKHDIKPKIQSFSRVCKDAYKLTQSDYNTVTIPQYRNLCRSWTPPPPNHIDKEALFWDEERLMIQKGIYGTDVSNNKTLFENPVWNVGTLSSILVHAEKQFNGEKIPGITESYTYYGEWATAFPLHKEDMDTCSVNYLHTGAPKVWYTVKKNKNKDLEMLLKDIYPSDFKDCPAVYRHKQLFPSPKLLRDRPLPYQMVRQEKGQFIVALNGCYHWGFNEGWNIAEAINFGTNRWARETRANIDLCPIGCTYPGLLRLDMDAFEKQRKSVEGDMTDEEDEKEQDASYGTKKVVRNCTKKKTNADKKQRVVSRYGTSNTIVN